MDLQLNFEDLKINFINYQETKVSFHQYSVKAAVHHKREDRKEQQIQDSPKITLNME